MPLYLTNSSPRKLLIAGGVTPESRLAVGPACCCEACRGGAYPDDLVMSISNLVNGSCDNCANGNDNWTVPLSEPCAEVPFWNPYGWSGCDYVVWYREDFEDVPLCDGYLKLDVKITWSIHVNKSLKSVIAGAQLDARLFDSAGPTTVIKWQKLADEPFYCLGFDNLDIPHVATQGFGCNAGENPPTPVLKLSAA